MVFYDEHLVREQRAMSTVTCFVGLDYHQDAVQVCVLDGQGRQVLNRSCPNDWRQIAEAVGPMGVVKRAAIEACSGAADLSEELAARAGWHVDLAHPGYVERMKRSPDKTDFTDGRMLADLTRVGYLPKVWLASAYERDLRQLVNHRQALVDQRRAAKLRVGALLREHRAVPPGTETGAKARARARAKASSPSRWTRAWVAWAGSAGELSGHGRWVVGELLAEITHLDKKVLAADARLREATKGDGRVRRLMDEPGVGEVTAWVLRAFVGRFDRFASGKQLGRYCGLSPCNASSGTRQADAGLVRGCNRLLRATLIQAAHRLTRTEPRWRTLADSMRGRGKAGSVIAAAVANRWARGLWHRMKQETAE
jgi:transposase